MKSRADLVSLCIAVVITLAGAASLFTAGGRVVRQYVTGASAPVVLTREHVAFVIPDRPPAQSGVREATIPRSAEARGTGAAVSPPTPVSQRQDTASSRIVPSNAVTPSLVPPAMRPGYLRTTLLPPRPRNPFLPAPLLTRTEMDSMLAILRDSMPALSRLRVMTVAERDSLMRVMANSRLVPGRPAQMPGYPSAGGLSNAGGISAPLFSSGPSAAERRRDSAANVEYLARLRRLQDRVLARRESVRVADSMSRARIP